MKIDYKRESDFSSFFFLLLLLPLLLSLQQKRKFYHLILMLLVCLALVITCISEHFKCEDIIINSTIAHSTIFSILLLHIRVLFFFFTRKGFLGFDTGIFFFSFFHHLLCAIFGVQRDQIDIQVHLIIQNDSEFVFNRIRIEQQLLYAVETKKKGN